jgi:hypothetical protein
VFIALTKRKIHFLFDIEKKSNSGIL